MLTLSCAPMLHTNTTPYQASLGDVFRLFDKTGSNTFPSESLGEALRAAGKMYAFACLRARGFAAAVMNPMANLTDKLCVCVISSVQAHRCAMRQHVAKGRDRVWCRSHICAV
jgi:hypothetical protein